MLIYANNHDNRIYTNNLYDNEGENYETYNRYNGGYDERHSMQSEDIDIINQTMDSILQNMQKTHILQKIQQGLLDDPDIRDIMDRIQTADISPFRCD